jgi:hypothetical protein
MGIGVMGGGGGPAAATVTVNSVHMVHTDGEHTLQVVNRNGQRQLTVRDMAGNLVFEGPIDTEAQRQAVPAAIRGKLEALDALHINVQPPVAPQEPAAPQALPGPDPAP